MNINYFEKYAFEDFEKELFTDFQKHALRLTHEQLVELFKELAEICFASEVKNGYEAATLEMVQNELLKRLNDKEEPE